MKRILWKRKQIGKFEWARKKRTRAWDNSYSLFNFNLYNQNFRHNKYNAKLTSVTKFQPWYNQAPPYGLRGYLDDRVNRLIGYAIVRQIREKPGSCKPAKIVRSAITDCTGESGISNEDTIDYCAGWVPKTKRNMADPDCTNADEYTYRFARFSFIFLESMILVLTRKCTFVRFPPSDVCKE